MSGDASTDEHCTTAVQTSVGESGIDYYDIMIIGSTGLGKSTTADKILIANPDGRRYVAEYQPGQQPQQQPELTADEHKRQLSYSDITMWLALGIKRGRAELETHLKFLTYCRLKDTPHEEVNKARSASNEIFRPTIDCEVLSNETSKVRIMHVPSFFDGALIPRKQTEDAGAEYQPVEHLYESIFDTMRMIVRVQTTFTMKFKRILYFLPGRGPLERSSAHLVLELKWMAHYFGTAIFKSMVLVATVYARLSKMPISDDEKFSQEDIDLTKKIFQDALKKVFSTTSERPLPDPPLIFISLTNTCEEILAKIQSIPVQQEGLYLQFDPNTCAKCGVKIGVVKGQRVTCYFGEDVTNAIPYEESTCHPFFVPRYTHIDKIWGGFKHIITFQWATGEAWPVFDGEKCVSCLKMPNTPGCMKVKSIHGKGKNKREVDHTSQVVNPVPDEEAAEGGDAREATANGSVAAEPPPVPQNGTVQHDQQNGGTRENIVDAHTSAEASIVALESGVSILNTRLESSSNQPYMVERPNRREVDHTSQIVNPVPDEEAAEGGDTGETTANVSVAYEHRQRERQPAEAENAKENADEQLQQVRDVKSGIPMAVDFLTEAMKLANVSFVEHNMLECDYSGIKYTNKKHNFSLQIPEGAIPRGEKIHFTIAIAMHGPFVLPKDTRLISPVLWLCPFEENITLNKPFQVVIPHILHEITEEKAKGYQLGFSKSNHRNNMSYAITGDAVYHFQPLMSSECNATFSSTDELGFGTATMSHFCYLCITAKNTPELKSDISYRLTRAERPATAQRHEVYFCVSYCLGTCIEAIHKQFKQEDGYALYSSSNFKVSSSDCVNILVQDDKNCVIARSPRVSKIWISEVDFQAHQYDEMRLLHNNRVYPPHVNVSVAVNMTTSNTICLAYNVEGTDSDQRLSGELLLPFNEGVASGSTISPIIQSQIERGERPFKVSDALRLTLPVASDWKISEHSLIFLITS